MLRSAKAETLETYGFDARTPLGETDPAWTEERRGSFLIRPEIARPLSVDRAVWPAVLDRSAADRPAPDYWPSLAALRGAAAEGGLDHDSCALVALAVVPSGRAAAALGTAESVPEMESSSEFLGYDVADNGLTSALSNSGFVPGLDDPPAIRRQWAPRLNEHGLFDDIVDAEEFRVFSDARVPEHAPFLVHALHLVPWT